MNSTRRSGRTRILDRCGNALTSQSVGPKILWLKKNRPEIFRKAAKIVTSTTYLVQKLTGECVIDHYSAANFSPLYVIDRKGWSTELAPDIIEPERLPKVLWSTDIAGHVTAKAARATGLAKGTPVIAGTIDAASEALSVGVINNGDMMVMYGSTIFTIMLSKSRIEDARLWYAPWLFPGEHASMAGLATSGTLTHWFRDNAARELGPDEAFAKLAKEAEASPPGANGLVVLPYFSGERTPIHDPKAKGIIFGLNLTHNRGDLYRALLEGIACGANHIVETYRDIGHMPKKLLAVGGGTRNRVWSQATSDISGMAQTVCRKTVGACYGDAFLAALAVGDVKKKDILAWNPEERRIAPNRKNRAVYERQYQHLQGTVSAKQGSDGGAVMSAKQKSDLFRQALDELGEVSARIDEDTVDRRAACSRKPAGSLSTAAAAKRCRSRVLPCGFIISACRCRSSAT